MKMTIALAMMPAQTAFAKFKDAASAALKQFVDGAADDDAFWGAVTEDLTNPLVSPLILVARLLMVLTTTDGVSAPRGGG
jgi:hypothetical protein